MPITKRTKPKVKIFACPTCEKHHTEHPEFGCFCCASCLQTAIRPLIVTLTEAMRRQP